MRDIRFTPDAFEQYTEWQKSDKVMIDRINRLLKETARSPFSGIGKPEALKFDLKGYWSRRISDEHRLVYRVTEEYIQIIACRLHYS